MAKRRRTHSRARSRRGGLAALAAISLLAPSIASAAGAEIGRSELASLGVAVAPSPAPGLANTPRRFCTLDTCRPRSANAALGAGSFGACILAAGWMARRRDRRCR
jgi:hypothetical protein